MSWPREDGPTWPRDDDDIEPMPSFGTPGCAGGVCAEKAEAELARARTVLTELLRLYDWRFTLAAREKDPRSATDVPFSVETARLLRQYGAEKKAAWKAARRVLSERDS
jgi:hypothetical protein